MKITDVSFAAVFTKNNDGQPFCSISFFIEDGLKRRKEIETYLVQSVLFDLSKIISTLTKDSLAQYLCAATEKIEKEFHTPCHIYVSDYSLSVLSESVPL